MPKVPMSLIAGLVVGAIAVHVVAELRDRIADRRAAQATLDMLDIDTSLPIGARVPVALARLAEREPGRAFQLARGIDVAATRLLALETVAIAWAGRNVQEALAQAGELAGDDQVVYRRAVLGEWSRFDPDAVFAYFEAADPMEIGGLPTAQRLLVAVDPERVLGLARRIPMSSGNSNVGVVNATAMAALGGLARRDLPAAYRHAAEVGVEGRFDGRSVVVNTIANADLDAALAWVRTLPTEPEDWRPAMFAALARLDFERAFDWLDELETEVDAEQRRQMYRVIAQAAADRRQADVVVARLLARDLTDDERNEVWSALMRFPTLVADLIIAAPSQADTRFVSYFADGFARNDLPGALEYAERVPTEFRAEWLERTAEVFGRTDADAAWRWIEGFRGQPGYNEARAGIVSSAASADPGAAARLLDSASAELPQSMARSVAASWARVEPASAAEWAAGLDDPLVRNEAITAVARAWVWRDPGGAVRWAVTLPAPRRDEVLTDMLFETASNEAFDLSLLRAFESESAGHDAFIRALAVVARRHPDDAPVLVRDSGITDPAVLQRAERQLASPNYAETVDYASTIVFR